jgi:anionic cell wall polymer biosynthesis LytR-Cps2A-Psr (LCP) family protein
VDAIGGVTVNINEPVAINGNTDAGIPPTDYLQPGPAQHLDGFQALWFARGRWGSDDYQRMLRQRCMVDALIEEADPLTVLRRYQDLAKAGEEVLRTDVPRRLMPAFVDLALRVKETKVKSVAFVSSDRFFSGDPDYAWVHDVVEEALGRPRAGVTPTDSAASDETATAVDPAEPGEEPDPGDPVRTRDVCGYHPVE